MPPLPAVLTLIIFVHLLLNGVVTRRVARSHAYEAFQKGAQIALIWLLPIIGVILVSWFLQPGERLKEAREQEIGDDDVEESMFTEHHSPSHSSGTSDGE